MNTGDLITSLSYGVYVTGEGFELNTSDRKKL